MSNLNKHIKDVHSQKVKCECCDKIFANKDTMRAHLKNLEAKPVRPEIPKEEQTCEEQTKNIFFYLIEIFCPHENKF